jgi:UDP-N-acetylmuramate dehydrogenase
MKDCKNYSLLKHNTFGIDAQCKRFLEYADEEEASQVAGMLREQASPYIIIGGGSNLLLTRDFDGVVVRSAIRGIEQHGGGRIRCGSGEVWDDVVAWCVAHQLYGAENLSLIPGDVGASAVQNIGAYGVEVKDLIAQVEAVEIATGKQCFFSNEDCEYGYRDSRFKHAWKNKYLITHVVYQLFTEFQPVLDYGNIRSALAEKQIDKVSPQSLRDTIIEIRNQKLPDPAVLGNAGSFFMNPIVSREQFELLATQFPQMPHYFVDDDHEKIPAGWLIDQCGWKGKSLGRAGVHDKQALVLVNRGGATGNEILTLCETIQREVKQRFGIAIHPEVNVI